MSGDDIAAEVSIQAELDHEGSTSTEASKCTAYTARVKVINPNNAGGNIVQSWSLNKTYVSVDDLKCELGKAFAQYVSNFDFEIGYIMPGHGMNGKLHGLADDEDLSSMYEVFEARKNFMLWIKCRVKSKKRPASSVSTSAGDGAIGGPNPKRSGSVYDSTLRKMHEVDVIMAKLEEKHKKSYSKEQIRCWANMIQIKQHESYEIPPNKPFFTTRAKGVTTPATSISPGKKINLRSEYIQQLDKWHDLKVRGIITEDQYKEFTETILSDMKNF